MTSLPVEIIHSFANAYKFDGSARVSGPNVLTMTIQTHGKDRITIDLLPGLKAALEAIREPDPHVVARAMDRLKMAPTEVVRVVGIWSMLIEEMIGSPNQTGSESAERSSQSGG